MCERTRALLAVKHGLVSLGVGALFFALLLATSPMLPLAWDEGNAIHRAEGIQKWFGRFATSCSEAFSDQVIDADWRYTTQVEGHPALYGAVIALGSRLTVGWLAPLDAARFGPMALFALAVVAATYRLCRIASPAAAVVGAVALATMPRVFAHAHLASFDGPLTSCWLLTWATFGPATRCKSWAIVLGVVLGMTMSCKFTGWFAPLPFVFWVAIFGDRRAAHALVLALPIAALTFWALNPPLWHRALSGLEVFLDMNLARPEHGQNVPTTYFGSRYDARTPLPWHNTLVWTGITVPVGTLALFGLGMRRAVGAWRARPELLLLIGHWAALVAVRATPWAPPHDAERLFLPSFAFLALIAGLGGDVLWSWARVTAIFHRAHVDTGRQPIGPLPNLVSERSLARGMLAAVLLGSTTSTIWYAPQWLSYYNLLVGGLRGAEAVGMEPTYYWDGLDAEVLAWLDAHSTGEDKIAFGLSSPENWQLMRHWGTLRVPCLPQEPGHYRWYVIQRRPSTLSRADRRLIADGHPAFQKTIRPPGAGWGPWRLDVPIVVVYDYIEFERAGGSQ